MLISWLRAFKNIFPYIGAFAIFISIINAMIYYSIFGVRILSFIDLSEALLLFLDTLILFAASFLGVILLIEFINRLPPIESQPLNADSPDTAPVPSGKFISWVSISLILFNFFFQLIMNRGFTVRSFVMLGFFLLLFIIGAVVWNVSRRLTSANAGTRKKSLFFGSTILITYSVIVIFSTVLKAFNIKAARKRFIENQEYVFVDGSVINTSDTLMLVGKTNNFMFFYKPKTDETLIFRVENLNKIIIK